MQTKTFVLYVINRDLSFDSTINKNIRNKIDVNWNNNKRTPYFILYFISTSCQGSIFHFHLVQLDVLK